MSTPRFGKRSRDPAWILSWGRSGREGLLRANQFVCRPVSRLESLFAYLAIAVVIARPPGVGGSYRPTDGWRGLYGIGQGPVRLWTVSALRVRLIREPCAFIAAGLSGFRFRGTDVPGLAGFRRGKECSKVLSIIRVGGEALHAPQVSRPRHSMSRRYFPLLWLDLRILVRSSPQFSVTRFVP